MDQGLLVTSGHKLIELLAASGMKIRGAMWVRNPELGTWRLWLVPEKNFKDKREFYRRIAEVISHNRTTVSGIDVSDTEFIQDSHPAMKAMKSLFKVTTGGAIHMSGSQVNGFYLPEGIILQMDL